MRTSNPSLGGGGSNKIVYYSILETPITVDISNYRSKSLFTGKVDKGGGESDLLFDLQTIVGTGLGDTFKITSENRKNGLTFDENGSNAGRNIVDYSALRNSNLIQIAVDSTNRTALDVTTVNLNVATGTVTDKLIGIDEIDVSERATIAIDSLDTEVPAQITLKIVPHSADSSSFAVVDFSKIDKALTYLGGSVGDGFGSVKIDGSN